LYALTPVSAASTIIVPKGWVLNKSYNDTYVPGTYFNNAEHITYTSADFLKCSHTGGNLFGQYIGATYDTGVIARVYYVYIEADIVVIGAGTTWNDVLPTTTTWNQLDVSRRWYQIFELDEAPTVAMGIQYKENSGDAWSTLTTAGQVMSGVVNARYFRVYINITDPIEGINALVSDFTLKLYI